MNKIHNKLFFQNRFKIYPHITYKKSPGIPLVQTSEFKIAAKMATVPSFMQHRWYLKNKMQEKRNINICTYVWEFEENSAMRIIVFGTINIRQFTIFVQNKILNKLYHTVHQIASLARISPNWYNFHHGTGCILLSNMVLPFNIHIFCHMQFCTHMTQDPRSYLVRQDCQSPQEPVTHPCIESRSIRLWNGKIFLESWFFQESCLKVPRVQNRWFFVIL